jgi:hypothetical protein
MRRQITTTPMLASLLAACETADTTQPATPSTPSTPSGGVAAHSVTGLVLDTKGRPMPNAKIWIRPALTTGLVQLRTGADGRYTATGLVDVPYYAQAWTEVTYANKQYCLRLSMPNAGDYDAFTPTTGAVRNFQWRLTGRIPDLSDAYFGGHIRLIGDGTLKQTDSVDVTLTPTAPLVDGSAAQAITRRVGAYDFVYDVPVGQYTASVTAIGRSGARTPLKVGANSSATATSMPLTFEPSGCGNDNGTSRAFIFWGS